MFRLPRKLKKRLKTELGIKDFRYFLRLKSLKKEKEVLGIIFEYSDAKFRENGGVVFSVKSSVLCESGDHICELIGDIEHYKGCIEEVLKFFRSKIMGVIGFDQLSYADKYRSILSNITHCYNIYKESKKNGKF